MIRLEWRHVFHYNETLKVITTKLDEQTKSRDVVNINFDNFTINWPNYSKITRVTPKTFQIGAIVEQQKKQ